jgi:hypothetical protein
VIAQPNGRDRGQVHVVFCARVAFNKIITEFEILQINSQFYLKKN